MQSIQDYIAAWNATTVDDRQKLLENCMTIDATYVDPHAPQPVQGIDGMLALITQFRSRLDHQLIPEGDIDRHHNVFRVKWRLQRESGDILSRGLMVGMLTEADLIERVIQFVDSPS